MTKVLISGASGYVGARLYKDLKEDFEVVGTYNNSQSGDLMKLDITSADETNQIVSKRKPDFIVHNGAFPVAPKDESSAKILQKVNFDGMKNIVNAANACGAKLIFISSALALDTADIYGQSKAYGEKLCATLHQDYLIIRPHTVFGLSPNTTNDRSFNRLLKNIFEKTPAIYDTSWKFQPTYIGHISQVIKLFTEGKITTNLISVAFEDLKSKYDIGRDILRHFNIEVTPIDEHSTRPTIKLDLSQFKALNLPIRTYEEMIETIINEIRKKDD